MNKSVLLILIGATTAGAQTGRYVNFIRHYQPGNGVVWDMPLARNATALSTLARNSEDALFQLWTIEQTAAKDYLLDQKLVGPYLPTADIQVWPVASGSITGIVQGDVLGFQLPQLALQLEDLYPRSHTYLLLYEGTQITGVRGTIVTDFAMDRETSGSHVIGVSGLESKIHKDGTYSLALVSDTVFGRELLSSVTFSVIRPPHLNAMLVDSSTDRLP